MSIFAVVELPKKLEEKLENRSENQSLRILKAQQNLVDFSSNDYLGLSKSQKIFDAAHQYLEEKEIVHNGATGSRLISGNHELYKTTEDFLSEFHQSESALIFNSGYDANVGFFSSVPQRGDVILYDEYVHASIRDGIRLSNAKSYKFKHNDVQHLEELLDKFTSSLPSRQTGAVEKSSSVYIVTESVFSMDGDSPNLVEMTQLVNSKKGYLIVDEAHAVGVYGEKGVGMIQQLKLENDVFARIITFGKAMGCHGAAILGSEKLKEYLINFARSLIYTTGLPPHSLATILEAYNVLNVSLSGVENISKLKQNIAFFKEEVNRLNLKNIFIQSNSSIHSCIIPSNEKVKSIANQLQQKGFDVKPILSPTVPENQERIRFCLHSYNSQEEMTNVLETLRIFVG